MIWESVCNGGYDCNYWSCSLPEVRCSHSRPYAWKAVTPLKMGGSSDSHEVNKTSVKPAQIAPILVTVLVQALRLVLAYLTLPALTVLGLIVNSWLTRNTCKQGYDQGFNMICDCSARFTEHMTLFHAGKLSYCGQTPILVPIIVSYILSYPIGYLRNLSFLCMYCLRCASTHALPSFIWYTRSHTTSTTMVRWQLLLVFNMCMVYYIFVARYLLYRHCLVLLSSFRADHECHLILNHYPSLIYILCVIPTTVVGSSFLITEGVRLLV